MSDGWWRWFAVALGVLLPVRCAAALLVGVSDCDEVFNYWEAAHVLYRGLRDEFRLPLQTWEYAPQFALRSWAFVAPYSFVAKLTGGDFVAIRAIALCAPCAAAEAALVASAPRKPVLLALLATSPGMFVASASFLPSAVALTLAAAHHAAWLTDSAWAIVFAVLATVWLGWPFVAVLFVPFAIDFLIRKPVSSIKTGLLAGLGVAAPVVAFDAFVYGRLASPLLNVLRYNAVEASDTLYGLEPASFYLKNLFLNCNIALLGLAFKPTKHALPAWLWLAVITARPHKEERFTYPAFVSIYVSASALPPLLVLPPAAALGASRLAALRAYYFKPQLDLWRALPPNATGHVCVDADWYRYPSTFFLPPTARLAFVASDFDGELPRPWYSLHSAPSVFDAVRADVSAFFNDRNRLQPDRYIPLAACDFLLTLDDDDGVVSNDDVVFDLLASEPILDPVNTPTLARAFLLPFYSHRRARFRDYRLLQRRS